MAIPPRGAGIIPNQQNKRKKKKPHVLKAAHNMNNIKLSRNEYDDFTRLTILWYFYASDIVSIHPCSLKLTDIFILRECVVVRDSLVAQVSQE